MKLLYTYISYLFLGVATICACSSSDPVQDEVNGNKPTSPEQETAVNNLKINTGSVNDLNINQSNNGEYKMLTTGADPWFCTVPLERKNSENSVVLTFEYKSSKRIDGIQVFFANPLSAERMENCGSIEASPSTWKTFSCNLYTAIEKYSWGNPQDYLRIDLGGDKDVMIYLRDIRLRGMNSVEQEAIEAEKNRLQAIEKLETELTNYLKSSYASEITQVQVTEDKVTVTGRYNGSGTCSLVEVTPYENLLLLTQFKKCKTDITNGNFTVTLDRITEYDGCKYDRLLSKWALVRTVNDKDELLSFGRYADADLIDQSKASSLPDYQGDITKGGESGGTPLELADLDALGLKAVLKGIPVTAVMWSSQVKAQAVGDQVIVHRYCGKDYYFSKGYFESVDQELLEYQKRNVVVFTVITIRPETPKDKNAWLNYDHELGMLLQHPDYSEPEGTIGAFSMVNLDQPESVNYYAAALDFLASRYSDGTHGRIHRYVLHNEIDDPFNWNNIGYKPLTYYVDYVTKSFRMGHNIIRQYNPHAQILVPVTQSWTRESIKPTRTEFSVKKIFNLLNQFSAKEGDFYWGVGYHSYPEKFSSKTWLDPSATFSMNTHLLTFKNLEVLDKWMKMPVNKYKGTKQRDCWLTENGSSTPNYTDEELQLQAACAAYALNKVKRLSGIQTLIWHAISDNDVEGNLNLGLHYRRNDPKYGEWGRKPSWYVYQAFGTVKESEVLDPYLKYVGVNNWDEIMHDVTDY